MKGLIITEFTVQASAKHAPHNMYTRTLYTTTRRRAWPSAMSYTTGSPCSWIGVGWLIPFLLRADITGLGNFISCIIKTHTQVMGHYSSANMVYLCTVGWKELTSDPPNTRPVSNFFRHQQLTEVKLHQGRHM